MQFSGAGSHMKGRVRWAVFNADGSIDNGGTLQPDMPSNNLILDQGIDQLDTNLLCALFENCAVGTGTSTPDASQVGLDDEKARTNNWNTDLCETVLPADGSSPYTITFKRGFDFPKGSLDSSSDGDYAELGFSPNTSAGQNLFSRALIKDGSGNTITVSVASDQILRIAYELDFTLGPSSPTAGSADITNIGTINYDIQVEGVILELYKTRRNIVSQVNQDGTTLSIDTDAAVLEPSIYDGSMAITSDTIAGFRGPRSDNGAFSDSISNSPTATTTSKSYDGAGTWTFDNTFATDQQNVTGVRNIMAGSRHNRFPQVRLQIDSGDAFDKQDTHELTLTFEVSYTAN